MTAVYETRIGHTRFAPIKRTFHHRATYWLTDVADLPKPPFGIGWLASFDRRDHFADGSRSIGDNARAVLAAEGIALPGGRILMLAAPRYLGYAFNPISVFWCYDSAGALAAIIAEVHNTYGSRHHYVLRTSHHATVAKDFYVSPFITVDGTYTISAPEPGAALKVTIRLEQDDAPVLAAWLVGSRLPGDSPWWPLLRHPLGSLRVAVLIRRHGVTLWLKRLPVVPRTSAPREGARR